MAAVAINRFHNQCHSVFCSFPHTLVERPACTACFFFLFFCLRTTSFYIFISFSIPAPFSLSPLSLLSSLSLTAVVTLPFFQPTPYLSMNSFSCHQMPLHRPCPELFPKQGTHLNSIIHNAESTGTDGGVMCFNTVNCEETNSWSLTAISIHVGGGGEIKQVHWCCYHLQRVRLSKRCVFNIKVFPQKNDTFHGICAEMWGSYFSPFACKCKLRSSFKAFIQLLWILWLSHFPSAYFSSHLSRLYALKSATGIFGLSQGSRVHVSQRAEYIEVMSRKKKEEIQLCSSR